MCGIVAIVAPQPLPAQAATLARMLAVIRHRGPDDEGVHCTDRVAFGFRRLSILDLSALGHQPMSTPDGAVTIVFNGEIYNFVELRRELEALGHAFRSRSDTEVLLHAYLEWGTGCLERLNGMWAFLIHDARTGTVFGSRDRFGIKPLYRYERNGVMLFGSEIKSIIASGLCQRSPNLAVAAAFLAEGRLDESDETFYAGVRRVPAAAAFEIDAAGRYREWRYWRLGDAAPIPPGVDPASRFAELFEDAVRVHMRSDVPVGIHLSGGLDSTSIACASARVRRAANATGPLLVFSYITPEFDESAYIRETVAYTGATLHELQTSAGRLWADLEQMLWYQDEPVHTMTALVSFQLMRATAAHGVKVILNGQGGDETLAGYPNFFRNRWHDIAAAQGFEAALAEVRAYATAHGRPLRSLIRELRVRRVLRHLNGLRAYRAAMAARRRARLGRGWYTKDLLAHLPDRAVAPADLDGALEYSQTVTPLPLYLRLEDRNAMAHSIEARLPFLDHRLVELAHALPGEWKLSGALNKFILRESMRGRIPESVRARVDKMGFPVPARQWFREQLFEPLMDLFAGSSSTGIVRRDVVERDVSRYLAGDIDVTDSLFELAQFTLWHSGVPPAGSAQRATAGGSAPRPATEGQTQVT